MCLCACVSSVGLPITRSLVQCPTAAVVVSLSKELYSYCSSPPSCINGDLTIAGEANAKLCMSHLMVEVQVGPWVPTSSSMKHVHSSCGVSSRPQEDLCCTDSGAPRHLSLSG